MNYDLKIFLSAIIIIFIFLCGCTNKIDEHAYKYSAAYSEVLLSPISEEEMNNNTLKSLLINEIEKTFPNISLENEDIFIWYNEPKYVAYNDLQYNKNHGWQYSKIDFLTNYSIMIESKVNRSYDYLGKLYESKEEARKNSKHLFNEDKEYLQSQILKVIEILKKFYIIEIIYEKYTPGIEYD